MTDAFHGPGPSAYHHPAAPGAEPKAASDDQSRLLVELRLTNRLIAGLLARLEKEEIDIDAMRAAEFERMTAEG